MSVTVVDPIVMVVAVVAMEDEGILAIMIVIMVVVVVVMVEVRIIILVNLPMISEVVKEPPKPSEDHTKIKFQYT